MESSNYNPGFLINLLLISRHIERLADHVTNIAEEVIYMIEGENKQDIGDVVLKMEDPLVKIFEKEKKSSCDAGEPIH